MSWDDLENDFPYLKKLLEIAENDVHVLYDKEEHYRGSWKQRGGIGAFMMLARKWDRIEAAVERADLQSKAPVDKYDIFGAIHCSDMLGDFLDDVRDLRRYLLLVEAYCKDQKQIALELSQKGSDSQEIGPRGFNPQEDC